MPRKHGPRPGIRPLDAIGGSAWQCIGCQARVSESRIACTTCWGRITRSIRDKLTVPYGESVHGYQGAEYRQAVAEATRWLERGRELTEAAGRQR